jgi:hypothetical protein
MYLVELRPGKEELYRSSDELALAIRNGDVDARSRVYHRATAKWISITLHPQYKAIVAAPKEEPAARPARRAWTLPVPSPSEIAPQNGSLIHRWQGPLALGLSGVLLLLGIQLAFPNGKEKTESATKTARAATTARADKSNGSPKAENHELVGESGVVSLASTLATLPDSSEFKDTVVSAPPPPESCRPTAASPATPAPGAA